ncbi:MAG: FtsX-like permease family protein [Armatimonadetes bacterium]|nr:FtsX-like permease family protein [Armatimonadota bacterium]
MILTSLRLALRALRGNPLRSILTMLGVIIGVAAVITTISIGTGARQSVERQFSALGTNLLTVIPGRITAPGGISTGGGAAQTLKIADAEAIAQSLAGVEAVAAEFSRSGQVVFGPQNDVTTISGVTPSFPAVRNWNPESGAFFTEADMRGRARVVVIGKTVKDNLFGDADPVGQTIRINRLSFTVIGVMEGKGSTGFSDRDDAVWIPLSTAQKRLFGVDFVRSIYVKVRNPERMADVQGQVEALLRTRHRIREGADSDFTVRNQAEFVRTFQGVNETITMLLTGIAAVSLIVGGIGIMNIMLVSVTERTREIGIRKAIGATRRDILVQFLVEAIVLSIAGGAVGIALAFAASGALASSTGWPLVTPTWAIALASGSAAAIGIFFGFYPAARASRLDPIQALRYE